MAVTAFDAESTLWILAALQFVGLLSAWLARVSEGSRMQTSCQWVFFATLIVLSVTTMLTIALHPWFWMTESVTLALMVLTAVWDFRRLEPTGFLGPA